MVPLSEWQVKLKKDRIIISTQKPGLTTWTFSPSKEGIAISTSAKNALLRGVAPAGEDRIPAKWLRLEKIEFQPERKARIME